MDVVNTNFVIDPLNTADFNYGSTNNYYGGEGDDEIWGPSRTTGPTYLHGGNGDDTIYTPYGGFAPIIVEGGGGKDTIRFDTYESVESHAINRSPVSIFGDWGYGPEDDPFTQNPGLQNKDSRREEKL